MRAREILLELREYIDRTKYGCWIYPDGKIEYVKRYGHVQYIMKEYNPEKLYSDMEIYAFAFSQHLVRIGTEVDDSINISGNANDMSNISHIILASCAQPEIESVSVDRYDNAIDGKFKRFNMPTDRRKLIMFMKGETE